MYRQMDSQMYRQTVRQMDRQMDRQTLAMLPFYVTILVMLPLYVTILCYLFSYVTTLSYHFSYVTTLCYHFSYVTTICYHFSYVTTICYHFSYVTTICYHFKLSFYVTTLVMLPLVESCIMANIPINVQRYCDVQHTFRYTLITIYGRSLIHFFEQILIIRNKHDNFEISTYVDILSLMGDIKTPYMGEM